jgi:predicted nucleotidyltransferase
MQVDAGEVAFAFGLEPAEDEGIEVQLGCSRFLLQMQYNVTAMLSLRSELRRRLLTYFYVNRSARVYVRQLAAALRADSTNVSRELARLQREGFLRSEVEGRQLYYSINSAYPYLKPVFALLRGSVGVEPTLKSALQAVEGIESAWLYGSFARNEADAASDIDLLIVGEPGTAQLAAEMRKAEQALRREINYTVLTSRELKRRLGKRDAFLADVWNGKRIELIGHGDEQTATRQIRAVRQFLAQASGAVSG